MPKLIEQHDHHSMTDDSSNCPYWDVPETSLWRRAVSEVALSDVHPFTHSTPFIAPETRVASAGSCFAQHISRHLRLWDHNYVVAEQGPAWLSDESKAKLSYGTFSARYGNIYTARQLLQLVQRAFDEHAPQLEAWQLRHGRFADPFRPRIEPDGFVSVNECNRDQKKHLSAVRNLFETLDVLVFTLGLTEGWRDRRTGMMLPVCPGCGAGGKFNDEEHEFVNFTVDDVTDDLAQLVSRVKQINPDAQIILTVSPVPLAATFEDRHVLPASVYSKSVLRVAAEAAVYKHDNVHYFASYEMVTALQDPDAFHADGRQVNEPTVKRVMAAFAQQFCKDPAALKTKRSYENDTSSTRQSSNGTPPPADAEDVLCDEDALVDALIRHQETS